MRIHKIPTTGSQKPVLTGYISSLNIRVQTFCCSLFLLFSSYHIHSLNLVLSEAATATTIRLVSYHRQQIILRNNTNNMLLFLPITTFVFVSCVVCDRVKAFLSSLFVCERRYGKRLDRTKTPSCVCVCVNIIKFVIMCFHLCVSPNCVGVSLVLD